MSHATQSKDFKNAPCAALRKKYSRNLGLYTDKHLNWQPQIQHVNNELAKSIGILSKLTYIHRFECTETNLLCFSISLFRLRYPATAIVGDMPAKLG